MAEWRLYPPLMDHWERQGFHVASQVADPRGARWEIDIAAFDPALTDVRLTEAKRTPRLAFAHQCLDRLRFAPRVYADEDAMLDTLDEAEAPMIGLLLVGDDDNVHLACEGTPTHERRNEGRARVLERVLRSSLA